MQRRGFTLLEILLAAAIFMTVMVVAVGVFGTTMSSSSTSNQLRTTSQAARYVFESITREIRSAHGLVVVDDVTTGRQRVVIKPFTYQYVEAQKKGTLTVNQVKKTVDGADPRYTVTRKTYTIVNGDQPALSVLVEEAENLTRDQLTSATQPTYIRKNPPSSGFASEGTSMIPDDLRLVDVQVPKWIGYQDVPDAQKSQPYVKLQLTIGSKSSGFAGQADKRAQTTLVTTIVPRDFASPYEVVQSRVTGGAQ